MQKQLELKTYQDPTNFPEAKALCKELMADMEKQRAQYEQRVSFLKQQFKIALRSLRPGFISLEMLGQLFDEAEMVSEPETEPDIDDAENKSNKSSKKRKKKLKAIPDHLPRTIIEHDLPEDQKHCPKDGSELRSIGYDVKEELKFIPAKFEVIEHRYPKYSCGSCHDGIYRKEPNPSLIPGGYASSELLAHIAVSKYCNHLPLYRLEQIFGREGVSITRQVMSDWMIKLGLALNPIIGIMHEEILDAEVVSADETPVRILTKDGIRTSKQAYMWQLSRWGPKPLVIFEFDQTRKKDVAKKLLGDYQGFVQIDGYGGYDILFEENSPRIRVGCMAHCLRKFKDFIKTLPKEHRTDSSANKIINMMRELYEIEEPLRGLSPADRLAERKKSKAKQIFDELAHFIALEKDVISTESPYYTALRYAHDELPSIRNYFKNGAIELDNNLAENAIRPFALGRRNWLFICAERGGQASANIYSLLITAKANGLEPYSYLAEVIKKLPLCETATDYHNLLPA